ncbi:hypothetical protein DFJ77DRAFT_511060 [Powellomyces hirtus]|nr:hypothetical protein DFJ77DRAFT_515731 [Powellomyces hirtus]KAI8913781.1 hypothetical protein DFJ77DRAFT_511060 [Powellomyces hirtus]
MASIAAPAGSPSTSNVGSPGGRNGTCCACLRPVYAMEAVIAHSKFYHKGCFRCAQCNRTLSVVNYETHNGLIYCNAHIPKTTPVAGAYPTTPGGVGSSGRRASEELQQLTANMAPLSPTTTSRSPFASTGQPGRGLPGSKGMSTSESELSKSAVDTRSPRSLATPTGKLTINRSAMQLNIPRTSAPAFETASTASSSTSSPYQTPAHPGSMRSKSISGSAVSVSERIKTLNDPAEGAQRAGNLQGREPLKLAIPPTACQGTGSQSDQGSASATAFGGLKAAFEKSPPPMGQPSITVQSATPVHRRATSDSAQSTSPRGAVRQQLSSAGQHCRSISETPAQPANLRIPRPRTAPKRMSSEPKSANSDSTGSANSVGARSDEEADAEDYEEDDNEEDDEDHWASGDLHSQLASKWRSEPGLMTSPEHLRAGSSLLHTKKKNSLTTRSGASSGDSSITSLIRLNVTALTNMEDNTDHPRSPDTNSPGFKARDNRKSFSMSLDTMLSDTRRRGPSSTKTSPTTPTQQLTAPSLPPGSDPPQIGTLAQMITSQASDLISIYENFGRFRSRRSVTGVSMADNAVTISRKTQMEMALNVFRGIMDTVRRIIDIAAFLVFVRKLRAAALKLATKEREAEREITNQGICDSLDALREAIRETLSTAHEVVIKYLSAQKELLISATEGYRLEAIGPDTDITPLEASAETPSAYSGYVLDHIDQDASYYRRSFYGNEHKNYIGDLPKLGPVIISLMFRHRERSSVAGMIGQTPVPPTSSNSSSSGSAGGTSGNTALTPTQPQNSNANGTSAQPGSTVDVSEYWAIMRTREGADLRAVIQASQVVGSSVLRSKHDAKAALQMLHRDIQPSKLRKVTDPSFEKRLMVLDELQNVTRYKFGVLYCKAGQTTEEQFFGNEHGSEGFETFLQTMGDKVPLLGWNGYAAGLDTKYAQTGTHSIHTKWRHFDVMFHVSTYLPHKKEDKQQIQRKRHIGNDIVTIVFLDGKNGHFDPRSIKSQFLHVFIAVQEDTTTRPGEVGWRVVLASNVDVPWFGPELPNPPVFWNGAELREFLLAKMINGENAAYKAPKFKKPHHRTRNAVLDEIMRDFGGPSSKGRNSHASGTQRSSVASGSSDAQQAPPPTILEAPPPRGSETSRRQSVFASLGAFARRSSVPNVVSPQSDAPAPPLPTITRPRHESSDASDEPESPLRITQTTVTPEALIDKKKGLKKLGRSKSGKNSLKSERKSRSTTALSSSESLPDQDPSARRKQNNSSSLLSAFVLKRKGHGDDKKYRSAESVDGSTDSVLGGGTSQPTLTPSKSAKPDM